MNFIDKTIAYFNPSAGVSRAAKRMALETIKRHYEASSHSRRTENWKATGADANTEIIQSLTVLRNRSREQVRNNPYARRAVQTLATNIVGTGIRPAPMDVSPAMEKRVMKVWKAWAGKKVCDFDRNLTFYGIQKLVIRTTAQSGECLVVRRRENNTNMPLSLQVLEPDFIDTHKSYIDRENGAYVMHGVQFDKDGRKQGYWLYENHPGGSTIRSFVSKFVKAEDVAHVYAVERPGQFRGVPWLVASMIRMKDFDEYEDAELVRQKIAACFTVFIQDSNPDAVMGNNAEADIASRVEPGIIEILPPGKQVSFAQPPLTNGYESYSRKILQGIAVGAGITYEAMTGDLSNVNFSSYRAGWIEFQRNVQDWQEDMLVPQLCETVWEWFVEAGSVAGKFRGEIEAAWTPPRREMIDPKKEIEGVALQVRNGFLSYPEALRQLGYDPDETIEEIAAFNKKLDELGIILDSDPRVGKMVQTEEKPTEDGEDDDENEGEDGEESQGNKTKADNPGAASSGTKKPQPKKATGKEAEASAPRTLKELVDAYGVGVRAGAITPTLDDEKLLRLVSGLPDVTKEVEDAWKADGGVRRPITLKVEKPTDTPEATE